LPDDKNDDNGLTADIPESVFEEALRAVEKIQSESRQSGGAETAAPKSKPRKKSAARDDEDLADLIGLLETEADAPATAPSSPAADPSASLESDLQVLSKLLEREYSLEREADFFRSVLWEDLRSPDQQVDEAVVKQKEGQIQELMANLRELQSEFEKFRTRLTKEAETAKRFGNEALILILLPIIDNLERAIEHADATEDKAAMVQGVRMILKQLLGALGGAGLTTVAAKGRKFDPNFHEALTTVETMEMPPNIVISEYQKGYLLFDRLIRPSRVVVSMHPEGNNDNAKGESLPENSPPGPNDEEA